MKQRGTDLESFRSTGRENVRPEDLVDVLKLPKRKWVRVRLIGNLFTYGGYWVKTRTKKGSNANFYVTAPSYNPETQERDSEIYDPWRDAAERINTKDERRIAYSRTAWMNVIVRQLQEDKPRRAAKPSKEEVKTGLKDKESETWTPVRALRLTAGLVGKIQQLQGMNTVTSKKTGRTRNFPVTHERFGRDIMIYFDPDAASPGDMYNVQISDRSPLTKEEQAFLMWDLSHLEEKVSDDETKREFESWAKRNGVKLSTSVDDEDEDLDDEDSGFEDDEKPKRKAKKSKKPKRKSKKDEVPWDDDDEDEADDEPVDDWGDDDEEEEKPKRKPNKSKKTSKKKSKKSKRKAEPEDEDEDELDDDWDEEEEEKPKKKSKKSSKKSSKKKKTKVEDDWDEDEDDDDDDLSEDDWDEDDDEEEKPKRKAKKSKKSKRKAEPEDEDEDDWGDDDDEDEDDEDWGDDEEDDEDDDW